jgi:hypothetical protein
MSSEKKLAGFQQSHRFEFNWEEMQSSLPPVDIYRFKSNEPTELSADHTNVVYTLSINNEAYALEIKSAANHTAIASISFESENHPKMQFTDHKSIKTDTNKSRATLDFKYQGKSYNWHARNGLFLERSEMFGRNKAIVARLGGLGGKVRTAVLEIGEDTDMPDIILLTSAVTFLKRIDFVVRNRQVGNVYDNNYGVGVV